MHLHRQKPPARISCQLPAMWKFCWLGKKWPEFGRLANGMTGGFGTPLPICESQ